MNDAAKPAILPNGVKAIAKIFGNIKPLPIKKNSRGIIITKKLNSPMQAKANIITEDANKKNLLIINIFFIPNFGSSFPFANAPIE